MFTEGTYVKLKQQGHEFYIPEEKTLEQLLCLWCPQVANVGLPKVNGITFEELWDSKKDFLETLGTCLSNFNNTFGKWKVLTGPFLTPWPLNSL